MSRSRSHFTIVLLILCAACAGCKGSGSIGSGSSGTAPVVLAMTDTPPAKVTILSAEVTLTGATLNPGSVSLFSGATTIELTRLQTDVAYLATTKIIPGSYTSLVLTFSNPMLTFENDTGGSIAAGVGTPTPTCAAGAICTIQAVPMNLSTTITLPATMTVSATSGAGLLVDVNLNNLLSATLGADFNAGATVSQFTPAGSGAPLVGAEDVVGQVGTINTTNNSFVFQNVTETFSSLTVDSTTAFLQFPPSVCTVPAFSCLHTGQILSVDISIRADGTPVARNVLFEDTDATDTEVEGIITNISTGSQKFTVVTLTESAPITGLNIGDQATVHYTIASPATTFEKDFVYADGALVDTTTFLFSTPADLIVGQQVQVRRNPNPTLSSGASITADRVRLRSSRVSGKIQTITAPSFQLGNLPSIFTPPGTAQIRVQTSAPTIFAGNATNFTQLALNDSVSVRGPLFANATTPTIIATKVLKH